MGDGDDCNDEDEQPGKRARHSELVRRGLQWNFCHLKQIFHSCQRLSMCYFFCVVNGLILFLHIHISKQFVFCGVLLVFQSWDLTTQIVFDFFFDTFKSYKCLPGRTIQWWIEHFEILIWGMTEDTSQASAFMTFNQSLFLRNPIMH